jgi:hypothetical protein
MKIKTDFNGKTYSVEKEQIEVLMKSLDLTFDEAVETYLDDEGLLENEEQNALDKKAQKIYKEQSRVNTEKVKKPRQTRNRTVSPEKSGFVEKLYQFLTENYENVEIIRPNKFYSVEINGKIIKMDIMEQRPPKK